MDPFSIVTGCVGLLSAVQALSQLLVPFISNVRDARSDMNAIRVELYSLSICVESLQNDAGDARVEYPEDMKRSLKDIIHNCGEVVTEMTALLQKLSSDNVRHRIQWAVVGRGDMNRLRSRLEAHKAALTLGVSMTAKYVQPFHLDIVPQTGTSGKQYWLVSLWRSVLRRIENAVSLYSQAISLFLSTIRTDMSATQNNTEVILAEIASLKNRLPQTDPSQSSPDPELGSNIVLQRFLDQSTMYTASVLGQDDLDYDNGMESEQEEWLDAISEDPSAGLTEDDLSVNPSRTSSKKSAQPLSAVTSSVSSFDHKRRSLSTDFKLTRLAKKWRESWRTRIELMRMSRREIENYFEILIRQSDQQNSVQHLKMIEKLLDQSLWTGTWLAKPLFSQATTTDQNFIEIAAVRVSALSAAIILWPQGHVPLVRLLLKYNTNVNERDPLLGTALATAIYCRAQEAIEILLSAGASVNQECCSGGSEIFHLALENRTEEIRALLTERYPLRRPDKYNGTALHLAASYSPMPTVRLLLDRGADVHCIHDQLGTALHCAAWKDQAETAKLLCFKGARVDEARCEWGTPLHVAARNASVSTARVLLDNGADPNTIAGIYCTPLIAARQAGSPELMQLLIDHGAREEIDGKVFAWAAFAAHIGLRTDRAAQALLEHGTRELKLDQAQKALFFDRPSEQVLNETKVLRFVLHGLCHHEELSELEAKALEARVLGARGVMKGLVVLDDYLNTPKRLMSEDAESFVTMGFTQFSKRLMSALQPVIPARYLDVPETLYFLGGIKRAVLELIKTQEGRGWSWKKIDLRLYEGTEKGGK